MKIKRLIVRLLFKLMGGPSNYFGIESERIVNWLAMSRDHRGFGDYFRKRDLQLLKAMGTGVDREKYLMLVGQRTELLRLLTEANKSKKVGK